MGKIFLFHLSIIVVFFSIVLQSCQLSTKRPELEPEKTDEKLVADEYSLKADREQLAEMRKAIPQELRQSNDELAVILRDFAGEKKTPSKIRQRFSKLVRKKRSKFSKDMREQRKAFNSREKLSRTKFLATQKSKRSKFTAADVSRSERTAFYRAQDDKRRAYFASERERRSEYESEIRQKRKDFNDYMRDRRKTFDSEMRTYSKKHMQRRREESKQKRMKAKENRMIRRGQLTKHPKRGGIIQKSVSAEDQSIVNEIEQAKQLPGQSLGTGE